MTAHRTSLEKEKAPQIPHIEGAAIALDDPAIFEGIETMTAFFDDEGAISFMAPGAEGEPVLVVALCAETSSVRGHEMLSRLQCAYPASKLRVAGVAHGVEGFWDKMQARGLVEGWTHDEVEVVVEDGYNGWGLSEEFACYDLREPMIDSLAGPGGSFPAVRPVPPDLG